MERSAIRGPSPHFATLHAGYTLQGASILMLSIVITIVLLMIFPQIAL